MSEGKTSNQHVMNFIQSLFGLFCNHILAIFMLAFIALNLACTFRQVSLTAKGAVCSVPRR